MLRRRICVFVPLLLALFIAVPAWGTTITVTNASDNGPGSLRAAIAAAAPGDTIDFNLAYPATIDLNSRLNILTSVEIDGPGALNLAISGGPSVQVLYVAPYVTVSISSLTIKNGLGGIFNNYGKLTLTDSTISGNAASFGGGIYNSNGTVTLNKSTVSGNSASFGAGVYNSHGALILNDSTVSGNISNDDGGGIFNTNQGTLTLTSSTISGNSAIYDGGGVENIDGTVTVNKSTVSSNSTKWYGGGIYNDYATLKLVNSTIAGNSTARYGGGIWNNFYSTLTVTNSTVSGNSASSYAGAIGNYYSTLSLKGTIVANSTGGNCWSLGGTATSDGHNLSDDSSCAAFLTSTTDQNNLAAGLDSNGLRDNGGPTKTVALLAGSPALDAIPVADCTLSDEITPLATDQRSVTRPQGSACDIGAFELVQDPAFSTFTAKLDIHIDPTDTVSGFDLNSTFTLGQSSNGINPLNQTVTLDVGTYQVMIPSGSFHQLVRGAKKGSYVFSGVIGGASVSVQIVPLDGSRYQFKAAVSRTSFAIPAEPVIVKLKIGSNAGSTPVDADFES